jgi:glutamyl endopeptidase
VVRRRWLPVCGVIGLMALAPVATVGCVDPAAPDVLVLQNGAIMQPAEPGGTSAGGRSGARGSAPEGFGAESVIGGDDRVPARVDTYPGRAVGSLTRFGVPLCTAFLVAPSIALTAGHCVHEGGAGGQWFDGLRFSPGRDGATEQYGSCAPASDGLAALQGFTRDGDELYDVGVILLDCPIGERVGWFGLAWSSAPPPAGEPVVVQGYAADRSAHTQWVAHGSTVAATATQLFHDADTGPGMSGGAVWREQATGPSCSGVCAVAVHAYGLHGEGAHAMANHGARMTERLGNIIGTLAGRSALASVKVVARYEY